MFTGIIEQTAAVIEKTDMGLSIARPASFDDLKIGASIAVSGVCLSVVQFDDRGMRFDVVGETWARTNLGDLNPGDTVNLERALAANGRFEGHIVQGHVEGVARVISVDHAPTPGPSPDGGEGGAVKSVVSRGVGDLKFSPKAVVVHAREMRKNPTKAEEKLWDLLRENAFDGHYFRRQCPIGNYILDFYCHELRLGIELDGAGHLEEEQRLYDLDRTNELSARGIRILRFSNDSVMQSVDAVLSSIRKYAQNSLPSPTRGKGGGMGAVFTIDLPQHLLKYVVPKGSIAIDGVSLTVAALQGNRCSIALIPHTLEHTTLGMRASGSGVNIETDILARHVSAMISSYGPSKD